MCIDPAKRYTATITTTKGTMTAELDPAGAPATVNNFVVLARYHYYDDVVFHRIIPGFVIQGGDPTGTGAGGPGYRFPDELFGKVVAGLDVVAALEATGSRSGSTSERVAMTSVTITEHE
jgi:cyclophilin family peptidyl-prolyl cis-trans isomerase